MINMLSPSKVARLAQSVGLPAACITAAARLLRDNCTVPFIVRYRAAETGSMEEKSVLEIGRELKQQDELEARRQVVLRQLDKIKDVPAVVRERIATADALDILEDIYLPFKPCAYPSPIPNPMRAYLACTTPPVFANQLMPM